MKKILATVSLFGTPLVSFAQGADAFSILTVIKTLMDKVIPVLITAALLFFIYGVVRYLMATDPDEKGNFKKFIVKGIIGLFLILSIWGIVGVIQRTFGVGNAQITSENVPSVEVF